MLRLVVLRLLCREGSLGVDPMGCLVGINLPLLLSRSCCAGVKGGSMCGFSLQSVLGDGLLGVS